jgi:subtilisin family serine protease
MKALYIFLISFLFSWTASAQSLETKPKSGVYYKGYFKTKAKLLKKVLGNQKPVDVVKLKKVKVAIIDTGVDVDNPFLISLSGTSREPASIGSIKDNHGHGTHVQGIVEMMSNKEVIVNHYKYYNKKHTSEESYQAFLISLKKAIDDDVDVINYSGGGMSDTSKPSSFPQEEYKLLKLAESKGIILVSAAGNEGASLDYYKNQYYPAEHNLSNIISVANYKNKNEIHKSSNYGDSVLIGALGKSIPSLCHTKSSKSCYMTGTSQATPMVASAVIKLKQRYPYISIKQIKHILKINSIPHYGTRYGFFDYQSFNVWLKKNYHYEEIMKENSKKNINYYNKFKYSIKELLASEFKLVDGMVIPYR